MKAFPMFIKTTDRRVVIVGGGEQAAQKARLLLKTDAGIVFAAPALDPEIDALVASGRASWFRGPLTANLFTGAAMVFVATGCRAYDVSAQAIAKAAHCLVNVVDQPDLCDLVTPSVVDRDPVVIAIGTEGTAPVLARQIKTRIERLLPQNLGGLAALAGRLRPSVGVNIARADRRAFWAWVFSGKARQLWDRGAEAHAARLIKDAIADRFQLPSSEAGAITIIEAGAGEPDLQTLRAVQRLQEADVIFYDRRDHAAILELARRDAERIFVGTQDRALTGTEDWLRQRVLSEATQGQRVVLVSARSQSCFDLETGGVPPAAETDVSIEVIPAVGGHVSTSGEVVAFSPERERRAI